MRHSTIEKQLIILIILSAISSLRLWNENLWYRVWMHQVVKTRIDRRKQPFVHSGPVLPPHLHECARLITSNCCMLKASKLTDAYKAFNSNQKGGAIYWHQLRPYIDHDPYLAECIERVQNFAREFAETKTKKTLYPFSFSMWNTFVLKYSGTKGSFDWHYDSEDANDYRVLICVDRTATCGHVEVLHPNGSVQSIELDQGQCYVLRGSTTYHRVTGNRAEDDERVMLGFHFSEQPGKTTRNLCYFSTLTGWKVAPALRIILTQHRY